ncbi:hypothetical protein B0O80DRAFT_430734 [Mortierella sp. GBAus27b]|nr:hypothetical protein B0O80DRAFT_430734 [Mortierella sp. GBAus27b]
MVKIHLAASSALILCASVCSALDLYNNYNYAGSLCRITTPPETCIVLPAACYDNVRSISLHPGWICRLHHVEQCNGNYRDIRQDMPALEDISWRAVYCRTFRNRDANNRNQPPLLSLIDEDARVSVCATCNAQDLIESPWTFLFMIHVD